MLRELETVDIELKLLCLVALFVNARVECELVLVVHEVVRYLKLVQ